MFSKHFINTTSNLVSDALEIIYSNTYDAETHVALISGGGAGHEPAHAAFVGPGMLSAAISGNIFASPGVKQIYKCVKDISGVAGTILIVKNYTGDLFHFHQAAQKLRAELGLRVEVVVVGDDASLERKRTEKVGRRGLAGTVLMHKILGAMALRKCSLEECLSMADKVNSGLATIGASLEHVHIPGQPRELSSVLGPNQIELGMGIHNEPGVKRLDYQSTPNELIQTMLEPLLENDQDYNYVQFSEKDAVILMVNNLGSLSVLELSAITTSVVRNLGRRNVKPIRTYSGTFMTSLNGPGFSITLLRVDDKMVEYLDAPTSALGWPVPFISQEDRVKSTQRQREYDMHLAAIAENIKLLHTSTARVNPVLLRAAVSSACQNAIANVPLITRYDTIVGDGDCGLTLQRGCESVLAALKDESLLHSNLALDYLFRISNAIEDSMDGTSGAIYGLFFNGLASAVRKMDVHIMGLTEWSNAAEVALKTLQRVTPARTGDRTMMDALEPFIDALKNGLDRELHAARLGAEKTKGLQPGFGRAVYVNEEGWDQVPDPGAVSVVVLIEGLVAPLTPRVT